MTMWLKRSTQKVLAAMSAILLAGQCLPFGLMAVHADEVDELEMLYELYQDEDPQRFRDANMMAEATKTLDTVTHNSRFDNYTKIQCIDVSKWQAAIDWESVAEDGIDQAIIRVGYRGYGSTASLVADPKYRVNMEGATAAGLDVGLYFYTQAITVEEGIAEAEFILSLIDGYPLSLPIYLDVEATDYAKARLDTAKLTKEQQTAICEAFCQTIEAGGYQAGVYANKYYLESKMNASELSENYSIWLAHYTSQTTYQGDYDIWQYSSTGSVKGITGNVDMNVHYVNENVVENAVDYAAETQVVVLSRSVSPALYGDGEFTFQSSDPSIATVDENGLITGVSSGTAVVTVTSSNGSSDSIEIIVSPPGDCNLDGVVDAADAAEILTYAAILGSGGEDTLTEHGLLPLYDFDGNGMINATDASLVLMVSADAGAGE